MATIKFSKDLEAYALALSRLGEESDAVTKRAVYAGAAPVADAIKKGLKTIPIEEGKNGLPPVGTPEKPVTGLSRIQKGDLLDGFGLAPIENRDGYVQTKAGFDGYGSIKTKKYPNGVPNQILARSVESGTSFRRKTPVIRKAVNASKKAAIETMGKTIDEESRRIFDGN